MKMTEGCCSEEENVYDCASMPEHKMCRRALKPYGFDIEEMKGLTSDPGFICKCCGRTANDSENLCSPTPLK